MSEYIEAKEIKKQVGELRNTLPFFQSEDYANGFEGAISTVEGLIDNVPRVQVKAHIRGKWIEDSFNLLAFTFKDYYCSVCGALCEDVYEEPKFNFCPYCGADMRGKENE